VACTYIAVGLSRSLSLVGGYLKLKAKELQLVPVVLIV